MAIDILINQLDEHNEGNILATIKTGAKEVYFLKQKEQESTMKSVREYYQRCLPNISIKEMIVQEGNFKELHDFIESLKDKDIVVNLTGGKRINSLILSKLIAEFDIKGIYVDILKKVLYSFQKEIKVDREEFQDLNLEDIISAAGGDIIEEATNLTKKQDLLYLTKQIYTNLETWHKYKQRLYDTNVFTHDVTDSKKVTIKITSLTDIEKNLIDKILKKLKAMNGIEYREIATDTFEVIFLKDYLKGFLFKSGTWLEIATNALISEIEEIDQVKSGVIFLWNDDIKNVRNEVDVIAVKDSIPICISCKDSDKYNEMALNELNVYSEKIAGKKSYKILVATKEPIKSSVKVRAKEMGIEIVIFDGNELKFKETIRRIIDKFSKFEI